MAINLLDLLMKEFRGDAVGKIATVLGESTPKTEAALGDALPAIVGGLVNKASTTEGANDLLGLLKRNNFDGSSLSSAVSAPSGSDAISNLMRSGGPLLSSVFGSRADSVTDWVASMAGITKSSSSSLLGLGLPVALGLIGKQLGSAGWSVSGLMSLLGGQKGYLKGAPSGLASILGLGGPVEDFVSTPRRTDEYDTVARRTIAPAAIATEPVRRGTDWWKWALPLLLAGALIPLARYFGTRREEPARVELQQPVASVNTEATPPPAPAVPA